MASILETVNNKREEIIAKHYSDALEELQAHIAANPLQTKFIIYAGCVSADITREIAARFMKGDVKATPESSGIFSTTWYLNVEIALPEALAANIQVPTETAVPEVTDAVASE